MKVLIIFALCFVSTLAQTSVGSRLGIWGCIGWNANTILTTARRCFHQEVLRTGDVVIIRDWDGARIWNTNTAGRGGYQFCLSGSDGNLVLFDPAWGTVWHAGIMANRFDGRFYELLDDGQGYVRDSMGNIIWRTGRTANC